MSADHSNSHKSQADAAEPTPIVEPKHATLQKGGVNWGPLGAVLIVVVSYFVAQFVASIAIALYPHFRHWSKTQAVDWVNNSVLAQFFFIVLTEGLTLLALWWFLRRRKANFRTVGLTRPQFEDLGYAVIGIAGYLFLYFLAVSAVGSLVHIDTGQQQDIGFQNASGTFASVLVFLSLVILPPIVEEVTFRGVLFSGLKRARIGVIGAALITSVLFAVPHLLESTGSGLLWIAGLDTFVLSLVLCYLRQKSGRLWAGIMVHAAKNGIAFVWLFVMHLH